MSDPANTLRFVVLHHRMPEKSTRKDHYDLMVQLPPAADGNVVAQLNRSAGLATWAIESALDLSSSPAEEQFERPGRRLKDHRVDYLEYEGEVSGGRGTVERVIGGTIQWSDSTEQRIEFTLLTTCGAFWRVSVTGDSIDDTSLCFQFRGKSPESE